MNSIRKLIDADKREKKLILVIGDGMTDIYIHGRLESSCQEGCVKFIEEETVTLPGGAANAARSLSNWNAKTLFLGPTGEEGPTKTRFMDRDGRCAFRSDDDTTDFDLSLVRKESLDALATRRPSAVLLSDYDKGTLTPDFIVKVGGICKGLNIPCVADCKRHPDTYHECILKGNANWAYRHKVNLLTRSMIVTNGRFHPVVNGRISQHRELPKVQCINHVGAGDCFASHLTLALAHGFSLSDAAAIAHSAGRVYVQHPHSRPPKPEEIAEDMWLPLDY